MVARSQAFILSLAVTVSACGSTGDKRAVAGDAGALDAAIEIPEECRAIGDAPEHLPNVETQHRTLAFWLDHLSKSYDMDEVLLTPDEIQNMNRALRIPREKYHGQNDFLAPVDYPKLKQSVEDRRVWALDKLGSGFYVRGENQVFTDKELEIFKLQPTIDEAKPQLRVALAEIPIRCAAIGAPFYSKSLDPRIDRNACSNARAQDVVRLIARWPNGMHLVQSRFSFGWIAADAPLSPPIPGKLTKTFVGGAPLQLTADITVKGKRGPNNIVNDVELTVGTRLPAADTSAKSAYVATATGFVKTGKEHQDKFVSTARGLTRRDLFTEIWRYLGTAYGLGGTGGGRDCSRLLLDAFEAFDLHLPRHSSWMAKAGTFWIPVKKELPESERIRLFDAAAQKGIVLLSFPGHIMLYLGKNEHGVPMVFHAFREYLEPCVKGADKLFRVSEVTISDLELGRNTERTAFVERVDYITVIGKAPGVELRGVAEMRPVAEAAIPKRCKDSRQNSIFISPKQPHKNHPVHVIAAMDEDPGPARFTLIDPDGERLAPDTVQLGGPPFGQVVTVDQPRTGKWKAILADGDQVLACQNFRVTARGPEPPDPNEGPVWKPLNKWTAANENLYSLFVERLFDYSIEEDRVWPNLHTLLQDPQRNILHDFRLPDEDAELELQPDCADLPYTLRAYYAWKMRLPFGYRRCSRARPGEPPECDQDGDGDNLISRLELKGDDGYLKARDDTTAFELFANTRVMRAVHSSSGRTHPEDEFTDLYPVPLTRWGLRPGTVFTDPYGHLLVVADWIPQGAERYGILVGADAQPDGTVGRRRFWRGSFLFDPDAASGGAGFKAFRPREYVAQPLAVELDMKNGEVTTVDRVGYTVEYINEELEKTRQFTRISFQQYRGSKDDFYNRVEALINPRPLDPDAVQVSLVDALQESVARRVNSVDNGENFMTESGDAVMTMPDGAAIFLTSGPWEDFATPSRDLRLLISIDSVIGFVDSVRAGPERFGLDADSVAAAADAVRTHLQRELAARTFTYKRSDGGEQTLSLKDVVDRAERLEMAYNPNDCMEIRWGAAPGSDEMKTCDRHAPEEQRQRMESYREWFATRSRPPQ